MTYFTAVLQLAKYNLRILITTIITAFPPTWPTNPIFFSILKNFFSSSYRDLQGVQTKLSRTLGPHCGWTNYRSIMCSINYESYTHVLSIFTLIVAMPSSYEDLEGYKWEEVDLWSAADFMTKLPQSPWLLLRPQFSYSHG